MGAEEEASAGLEFERNAPYAPSPDNRPVPLQRGRLPLTREANWQVSFGERAALEGVLAQLQPGLALEIGSAEGGSMQRIAVYSQEVHSIDVTHESLARPLPPHVSCHTGPTVSLLRPPLRYFVAAGRILGFILVDGDHSYEGIRGDLARIKPRPPQIPPRLSPTHLAPGSPDTPNCSSSCGA
jgi:hypothetical protein